MRCRAMLAVGLLALLASACAPTAPLEIGSKQVPADITLGDQAPPRPPNLNPGPIGFPGFLQPPIPRVQPGPLPPPPPADPCPIANPLDAAELVARASAPLPPVEATYTYRNRGSFTVGDAAPVEYPPTSDRSVTEVRDLDDGNYEFDVAIPLATTTTTTTYRVLNAGDTLDRGVFITGIVTESSDGADAFFPEPPILLMPFPPPELGTNLEDELAELQGDTYRSSGTDPLAQTTMTLEATIAGKIRVDACGEWIDAFDVTITSGRIVGPNKQIEFSGTYAIAPQYGGLVVEDDIQISGFDDFQSVESRNRARINRLPDEPLGTL